MAKRNQNAARRARISTPPPEPREQEVQAAAPAVGINAAAFGDTEHDFFRRGDAGIVEPPVYLPYDSVIVPLLGVLLLAGLSYLVMM